MRRFQIDTVAPGPPDEEALKECADLDALLVTIAAPLRIAVKDGQMLGEAAYDLARDQERRKHIPRVRALHQVANAYAAIFRAREVASGIRCRESLAYRLKEARRETEMARVVILGVR